MKRNNLIKLTSFISILFVGFVSILRLRSQLSKIGNTSSLRGNLTPLDLEATIPKYENTYEETSHEDTNPKNNEEQFDINTVLQKAKSFLSEASASELENSTEILHEAIQNMKSNIQKTLKEVLKYYDDISSSQAEAIEHEVYKKLEDDIIKRFKEVVELYLRFNEDNLDAITEAELNSGKSNEEIERDIKYESTFLMENLNNQIDMIEEELEATIHDRAQKIEKNVVFDRAGVELSNNQLDQAEVDIHISDIEQELMERAAESETIMYNEVSVLTNKYKDIVNKILEDLLMKKKISSDDLEDIKKVIHSKIDEEFEYLFGDETLMLEDIIDDTLIDLENAADEDRSIIDRATDLGMVDTNAIGSKSNNVDIIEKDLDEKKNALEMAITKAISTMEGNIVEALSSAIGDIEERVFREKGVDLSEEELRDLIDVETKNMNELIDV